jgi:DNA-binding transcriptional ArsR family regulator
MLPSFEKEIHQMHSQLCAGLADPKRILILYALAEKSLNVSELTELLGLTQSSTSRHLKILRDRNLVVSWREGQSVYYKVADGRIIQSLDLLRELLADLLQGQVNLARSFNRNLKSAITNKEIRE